jgi:AcrR family transcriptional regulator
VDLLAEVGYERLTTGLIAARAGVSKGAQAHHFPTKDDLLVAAFGHLLARWDRRREAFMREHEAGTSMDQILDYLWQDVFGRADYLASVEMLLAARHHPALRERLREVLSGWTVARNDTFRRLVDIPGDDVQRATFLQLNLCLLRGLAIVRGIDADPEQEQRVLAMWRAMAATALRASP